MPVVSIGFHSCYLISCIIYFIVLLWNTYFPMRIISGMDWWHILPQIICICFYQLSGTIFQSELFNIKHCLAILKPYWWCEYGQGLCGGLNVFKNNQRGNVFLIHPESRLRKASFLAIFFCTSSLFNFFLSYIWGWSLWSIPALCGIPY